MKKIIKCGNFPHNINDILFMYLLMTLNYKFTIQNENTQPSPVTCQIQLTHLGDVTIQLKLNWKLNAKKLNSLDFSTSHNVLRYETVRYVMELKLMDGKIQYQRIFLFCALGKVVK